MEMQQPAYMIHWLSIIITMTAVMWLPYVINMILKQGLAGAMGYAENLPPLSPWAQRAKKAHYNAIENLAIFAPAVLCFIVAQPTDFKSVQCAMGFYFFSRLAHYLCYTFKVPYLRTLTFAVGWGATLYILLKVCEATQA